MTVHVEQAEKLARKREKKEKRKDEGFEQVRTVKG